MEVVTGGTGRYAQAFGIVLIVGLHALLAFGTLSGVLLNAAIAEDLGVPLDVVALGNSLVFFGWIPGAILSGPLGDRIGRKPALLLFALLASFAICVTGLVPAGTGWALLLSRAVTGVGIGGFIAPSFTLLVESSDPRRSGRASVFWTWGYVAGVAILCGLHLGVATLAGGDWRVEELVLGAWGFAFAAASQAVVIESPRFLLASGDTLGALDAARSIAVWNGVDLDREIEEAGEAEPGLRALKAAASMCVLEEGPAGSNDMSIIQSGSGMQAGMQARSVDDDADGLAVVECAPFDEEMACTALEEADVEWTALFRGSNLPLTLTFGAMEVAYNMAFYVIVFSAGALSDQLLLNLVLLAAADLPGSTLAGTLVDRTSAKVAATAFLAGAAAVLVSFAGFEGWAHSPAGVGPASAMPLVLVPSALSLLGKSLCSGAFTAIFVLFSECYPTRLRSAALGGGMMFGKMGASVASPLATSVPLVTSLGITAALLAGAAAGASTLPKGGMTESDGEEMAA